MTELHGPTGFKCLVYNPQNGKFDSISKGDGFVNGRWNNNSLDAECQYHYPHKVPDLGCTCGIYATYSSNEAIRYALESNGILCLIPTVVLVRGTGKVIEHLSGFRCEHAEIVAIVKDKSLASFVPFPEEKNGLPVVTIQEANKLIGKQQLVLNSLPYYFRYFVDDPTLIIYPFCALLATVSFVSWLRNILWPISR